MTGGGSYQLICFGADVEYRTRPCGPGKEMMVGVVVAREMEC